GLALALARLGLGSPGWDLDEVGRWLVVHGFNVVVIVTGTYVTVRAANFVVEHLQLKLARLHAPEDLEYQRRAATLGSLVANVFSTFLVFSVFAWLRHDTHVNAQPVC